jgi:hypothetical protein
MYNYRSEYQYIDKAYFIDLFSDNYFNIVNESDEITSSEYIKGYSKKDLILLNQSIHKIIIYPSEYLTKEELYKTIGLKYKKLFNIPQYRTLFNTDNIESFFKSLKEYTKTKGLKLCIKREGRDINRKTVYLICKQD